MISPTLQFPGTCDEAITFYEQIFPTSNKHIDYYRDAPANPGFLITESMKDLVMHASITICGTPFNCSDTLDPVDPGNMICFNTFLESPAQVTQAFHQLKEGGTIIVDLGPQFFSPMYGSVIDRFGVKWQLIS